MSKTFQVWKSNEWRKYFPEENIKKNGVLTLTEQGMYSITKPMEAKQIIGHLMKYVASSATVLDGTAGCGGDTISLASQFNHVISVELNKSNCECLKTNIAAYNFSEDKIEIVCPDSLIDIVEDSEYKYDVLFLDPPWGGRKYKEKKALSLYLCKSLKINLEEDDKCFEKIIAQKIANNVPDKLFVMKVPINFNLAEFKNEISGRMVHRYPIFKYYYEIEKGRLKVMKTNDIAFLLIVVEGVKKGGSWYKKYVKYKTKYLQIKQSSG
ncbi:MAG: putative RNA methylase [Hyperionvirus sp.]|uniref:Putative RNA methylase n=1 Tax=Hyperionvirus sp. TaxID=2487770 RepID=A0A3G5AA32_9VIRU|nr:MAG: putative RNA methylase [Hyperionvirus sp.]